MILVEHSSLIDPSETKGRLKQIVKGKRVLFVATTYVEYLRIQQELSLIKESAASVEIIIGENKYYFLRLLFVYWKLLISSMRHFDVVFIGFAPQLVLPLWKWKFKNKIIIIDFFISLYDTLVCDRKKFKESSFAANSLLKIDKITLRHSDWIIADTKKHADFFKDELNADGEKLMVLYLEADKKIYYPLKIKKNKDYQDKFVVFYFASILPLQGVDFVIKAFTEIRSEDFHFIFVGPIDEKQKKVLFGQKNLSYFSWLSQDKLAGLIAQSDLCLAGHFCDSIEKAKRTIPGKAYIFEAMNKKIILGDNEANRERYPFEYNKVIFVKMGSAIAIVNAINNSIR